MKGVNVMEISEAEMKEAMQYWASKRFTSPVKVTRVEYRQTGIVGVKVFVHMAEDREKIDLPT